MEKYYSNLESNKSIDPFKGWTTDQFLQDQKKWLQIYIKSAKYKELLSKNATFLSMTVGGKFNFKNNIKSSEQIVNDRLSKLEQGVEVINVPKDILPDNEDIDLKGFYEENKGPKSYKNKIHGFNLYQSPKLRKLFGHFDKLKKEGKIQEGKIYIPNKISKTFSYIHEFVHQSVNGLEGIHTNVILGLELSTVGLLNYGQQKEVIENKEYFKYYLNPGELYAEIIVIKYLFDNKKAKGATKFELIMNNVALSADHPLKDFNSYIG